MCLYLVVVGATVGVAVLGDIVGVTVGVATRVGVGLKKFCIHMVPRKPIF